MKNLFILSGPSGAGEDSIIRELGKKIPIDIVKTTSTRTMRIGESQGNPYYFIDEKNFKKGLEENKFFEWAKQYNDNYYGVTYDEIERVKKSNKIGIWKIEYQGVITVKKLMPQIPAILIYAPLEQLEGRIRRRDKIRDEKFFQDRMTYSKKFYEHRNIYDYEVNNFDGKLAEAVENIMQIIKNHKKPS